MLLLKDGISKLVILEKANFDDFSCLYRSIAKIMRERLTLADLEIIEIALSNKELLLRYPQVRIDYLIIRLKRMVGK